MAARIVFYMVSILLGACALLPPQTAEQQRLSIRAKNAQLNLTQTLSIPAGQDRIFMQEGKVLGSKKINLLKPHCELHLKTKEDQQSQLNPENFNIIHVTTLEEDFGANFTSGTLSGASSMLYSTRMELNSVNQTAVFRFMCNKLEESNRQGHVTFEEFRHAVGPLLVLETKNHQIP